jgi:hypothetical protein
VEGSHIQVGSGKSGAILLFQPICQELYQFRITVYVLGNSEEFFGHPLGFDGQIFLHKEGILVVSIIFPFVDQ